MYRELTAILGKHIDSPEFKSVIEKLFTDFKKFDKNKEYKDKKSKVVLRIDSLTSYDDTKPTSQDPKEYQYFTAFFFGKDQSEIPFGITSKDDEATVIKKAGKPTHHNKNIEGGSFTHVNDMHYHIENYKMIITFDPASGKQWGIGINLRLKGMKF
jgi:NDP-sugar pyrophosphorylase family protein